MEQPELNTIIYSVWRASCDSALTMLVTVNVSIYLAHTCFMVTWRRSAGGSLCPDHGLPARMVKVRRHVD